MSSVKNLPPQEILLVDDEPLIRDMVGRVLRGHGFGIIEAENGRAALALFKQHSSRVSLLLTDVIMPELSGAELAVEILRIRPQLPLLFISAYPERIPPSLQIHRCLAKPFKIPELIANVREFLHAE
jgi:two-component system cell cycle sensor histidine kinase/response regulator CckA